MRSSRSRAAVAAGITFFPAIILAVGGTTDDKRPRHQDFVGVFYASPDTSVPPGPNAERCPDPGQPILFTFTGYAYTNLGKATFVQSHCEATDNSSFGRGQEAITFENGDKLFGTYEGDTIVSPTTATDFQVIVDGTYRNTGGTGALARAHGRGISAGHVDVRFGTARIAVSGSL